MIERSVKDKVKENTNPRNREKIFSGYVERSNNQRENFCDDEQALEVINLKLVQIMHGSMNHKWDLEAL